MLGWFILMLVDPWAMGNPEENDFRRADRSLLDLGFWILFREHVVVWFAVRAVENVRLMADELMEAQEQLDSHSGMSYV